MNPKELHTLGIDIGSTTVKIAILDEENEVLLPTMKGIMQIFRRLCRIFWGAPSTNSVRSMSPLSSPEAAA